MIKAPSKAASPSVFPDMTALLDVIFILLVFLLLTANAVPKVLPVSLPSKGKAQAQPLNLSDHVSINIFSDASRWGLNGEEYLDWISFEDAMAATVDGLSKNEIEPQIIIAGDKQASLEKTLRLLSWLQGKDLSAAQVMMNPD